MKVFISHATKDSELVNAFVDMLRLGIDLKSDEIYCTLRGDIPLGERSIDHMRDNLQNAAITVALITPTFYERQFCLIELGAVWIQKLPFIPMVLPPLGFDDLKGTVEGVQAGMLDSELDLGRLKDAIVKALSKPEPRADDWDHARKRFLERLKSIVEAENARQSAASASTPPAGGVTPSGGSGLGGGGGSGGGGIAPSPVHAPAPTALAVAANPADISLFRALYRLFQDSGSIMYLRNQSLGAKFPVDADWLKGLDKFAHEWTDAAHEFADPVLDGARKDLLKSVQALSGLISQHTVWLSEHLRGVVRPHERANPDEFDQIVAELDDCAADVVEAHETLMRLGRERLAFSPIE